MAKPPDAAEKVTAEADRVMAGVRRERDRAVKSVYKERDRALASVGVKPPGLSPADAAHVDAIRAAHGADAHTTSHDASHGAGHGDAHAHATGGHGHAPKRPPNFFEKGITLASVLVARLFSGKPTVDAHGHDAKGGHGHGKEESSGGIVGGVESAASAVDKKVDAGFDWLIKFFGGKPGKKGGGGHGGGGGGHH